MCSPPCHLLHRACAVFAAVLFGMLPQPASFAQEAVLKLLPNWEYVSDRVMGGVSTGRLTFGRFHGRDGARLTGRVSLENNGGFLQMALDVSPDGRSMDVSGWQGIEIEVRGNGETYDIRLRTAQLTRPWQSFRAEMKAQREWQTLRIAFTDFVPHRTDEVFDPAHLRRIGVLAIGRVFEADVAVAGVGFYR
jgi:hypothetical protein